MNFVGNFLEKFSLLLKDSEDVHQQIIESIEEVAKIKLTPQEVVYREGVIKLIVKPIFKTEIKLKEGEILNNLNQKTPKITWKKII